MFKVLGRPLRSLIAQLHCAGVLAAGAGSCRRQNACKKKSLLHPSVPPLQPLLLWQSLTLAWLCGLWAAQRPEAALLCLALLIWVDSRLRRLPALAAALAVCCLGLGAGLWSMPQRPDIDLAGGRRGEPPRLSGVVDKTQGVYDDRLRVILRDVRLPGSSAALPGKVGWTWDRPSFLPLAGQRVEVSLRPRPLTGLRNPGVADMDAWWERQGVFLRLWSRGDSGNPQAAGSPDRSAAMRHSLYAALLKALLPADGTLTQGQAFLPALLFGDRSRLSSVTMDRMSQASLAHSLALSGQHLALAALAAALLARLWARFHADLYLRVPYRKLVLAAGPPLALAYLWMGGAPASLLRAFCMLVMLALLVWKNRVISLTDILMAALAGITLCWPQGVFDAGLQLSALCVGALALASPALRRLPAPPGRPLHLLRRTCQILTASLVVQTALLPVSLTLFGHTGPWFALNALWLPALGLWVLPLAATGMILAATGVETAARLVLWLAAVPCDLLLEGLDAMARHGLLALPALLRPHWTTLPAWAALAAALALLPGRGRLPPAGRRLAAAGMLLLLAGPLLRATDIWFGPLRMALLDVGQGQAVLLRLPGGQRLLIDGGGSASARFDPGRAVVGPTLAWNAAPRLFAVLASHPDTDHLHGLGYILDNFAVTHVFHNGETPHADAARAMRIWENMDGSALHAGMTLDLPSTAEPPLRLEVLHPPPPWAENAAFAGNDNSLILRLVQGDKGLALLPGDAELPALRHVLASGRDVRAEVLILPHHGSRHSLSPEFYDAVKPRLALTSCGRNNRYNYPAPAVRRELEARSIPLRSTAAEGRLEVRWPLPDPPSR